jgi:uncharacterized protein with von Willebrand factor type A (vWA) domain
VPEWIDSPAEVLTLLSILGVVLAGLVWMIRAQIAQMKELKPNHGSSMRDAVDRIEIALQEIRVDVRDLRKADKEQAERLFNSVGKVHGRMDEHIHDHMTGRA